MPFKQGRKPALVLRDKAEQKKFRGALLSAGYKFHTGPRTTRDGEIQAWVALIGRGRQSTFRRCFVATAASTSSPTPNPKASAWTISSRRCSTKPATPVALAP